MLTDFWPVRFEDRLLAGTGGRFPGAGRLVFRSILELGCSAVAAGRRYNGLEHIKRLHANLAVGLAVGGDVQDVSGAKLLAFPVDIESHAVVGRRAAQPHGQTANSEDKRLGLVDVLGIFRRNKLIQCRLQLRNTAFHRAGFNILASHLALHFLVLGAALLQRQFAC